MSTIEKLVADLDISISKLSETMTDYGKGKLQAFKDVKFHIQNKVPDNEAELRKENEEMKAMLEIILPMFTELDSQFGKGNPPERQWSEVEIQTIQKISDFLNKY